MKDLKRKLPKEKRGKGRGPISVPVSYTDLTADSGKEHEGATADLSAAGLGIFSHEELKSGSILEIECPDIWSSPHKFTVRWCNRVGLNFYRVGLTVAE